MSPHEHAWHVAHYRLAGTGRTCRNTWHLRFAGANALKTLLSPHALLLKVGWAVQVPLVALWCLRFLTVLEWGGLHPMWDCIIRDCIILHVSSHRMWDCMCISCFLGSFIHVYRRRVNQKLNKLLVKQKISRQKISTAVFRWWGLNEVVVWYTQPIPPPVTFSKARSQGSKSKLVGLFCHVSVERNIRALALSFGKWHCRWDWL